MLGAVVAQRVGTRSIVLTGDTEATKEACLTIRARVRPGTTAVRVGDGARWSWLEGRNELLKTMDARRACVQVCEEGMCREVLAMGEVERALSWGL